MSDANRFDLLYIEETNEGELPATPDMTKVRLTGEGINYNVNSETSQEIRSDRQIPDSAQVSADVGGPINFELSYAAFDDFLRSVLYKNAFTTAIGISATDIAADNAASEFTSTTTDFTANNISVGQFIKVGGFSNADNNGYFRVTSVATNALGVTPAPGTTEAAGPSVTIDGSMLKNGTDIVSFSMEKQFEDANAGAGEFMLAKGMRCGSLQLQLQSASRVTGNFGFLGRTYTPSGTTSANSESEAPQNSIMNATSNVALIREGGSELTDPNWASQLTLNIDNSQEARRAIGNLTPIGVRAGRCNATISLQTYFGDRTLYEKLVNDTESEIMFAMEDSAGNAYVVDLPRLAPQSGEVMAEGPDQDVYTQMELQALRHATYDFTVAIHKF